MRHPYNRENYVFINTPKWEWKGPRPNLQHRLSCFLTEIHTSASRKSTLSIQWKSTLEIRRKSTFPILRKSTLSLLGNPISCFSIEVKTLASVEIYSLASVWKTPEFHKNKTFLSDQFLAWSKSQSWNCTFCLFFQWCCRHQQQHMKGRTSVLMHFWTPAHPILVTNLAFSFPRPRFQMWAGTQDLFRFSSHF